MPGRRRGRHDEFSIKQFHARCVRRKGAVLFGRELDRVSFHPEIIVANACAVALHDHNDGVYTAKALHAYLSRRKRGTRDSLLRILRNPSVAALEKELAEVTRKWQENRKGGPSEAYLRMTRMKSPEFARQEAAGLSNARPGGLRFHGSNGSSHS